MARTRSFQFGASSTASTISPTSCPFRPFFSLSRSLASLALSCSLTHQEKLNCRLSTLNSQHALSHRRFDDPELPTAFETIILKDKEAPAARGSGGGEREPTSCQVRGRKERARQRPQKKTKNKKKISLLRSPLFVSLLFRGKIKSTQTQLTHYFRSSAAPTASGSATTSASASATPTPTRAPLRAPSARARARAAAAAAASSFSGSPRPGARRAAAAARGSSPRRDGTWCATASSARIRGGWGLSGWTQRPGSCRESEFVRDELIQS